MLLWQLDRLRTLGGTLVVASPGDKESDPIRQLCNKHGYEWMGVCGDPNHVLNRYVVVAEEYDADHIIRVTGDCPLIDPAVVEACIEEYYGVYDHVGIGTGWPDGQDAEVFSRAALQIAHDEATRPSDMEHVTPFIYRNTDRFRCHTLPCPFDLSWQLYSVDTPQDLRDVEDIMQACLARYGDFRFGWREIWRTIETLQHVKARMLKRVRNHAYVAQVQKETGQTDMTWDTIRYTQASPYVGKEF
jgi:spore coat polysaccharide biosynthesis protein SpsF